MMSNGAYPVTIPDADYWRSLIKCQAACPVLTDARAYVTAVARQDFESGYEAAHDPNPLATICGRICGAPCEAACRRGHIGPHQQPVAIRPLKRTLTEQFGPEAEARLTGQRNKPGSIQSGQALNFFAPNPAQTRAATPPGAGSYRNFSSARWSREELRRLAAQPARHHGKVAVVGAGPAGLTAAHNMALLGHQVTIFEAGPKLGGMIRYGVPAFRFDQDAFDLEIQSILDMGVEVRLNTPIGKKAKLADLRRHFDAVFLGLGLMHGRMPNIEGAELDGVMNAVDLLLNVNLGHKINVGRRVLVIGGGDAALQSGQKSGTDEPDTVHTALDVARTALRLGAAEVTVIAPENRDQLPISDFEVEKALEEGIRIFPRRGPQRIVGADGRVTGVEVVDVKSVFDAQGNFAPAFKPGAGRLWECDTVILAVGQQADVQALSGADDLQMTPRGFVKINPETGETTVAGVFAGGDIAYGPRLIIHAVKDGHIASLGMEAHIQGHGLRTGLNLAWAELPNHVMFENWTKLHRQPVPSVPVERRTGISVVELGYSAEEAAAQGSRCLECSVNTIFDGSKCILCNGCVDVCPWDCLKIVSLKDISGDESLAQVVELQLGAPLESWQAEELPTAAAMLKDDSACTRCALCADRCPTGAITMEAFRFQETLRYA